MHELSKEKMYITYLICGEPLKVKNKSKNQCPSLLLNAVFNSWNISHWRIGNNNTLFLAPSFN